MSLNYITAKYLKRIELDNAELSNTREHYGLKLLNRGVLVQPFTNVDSETFNILDKLYGFDMQAANSTFYASMQERLQLTIGEFLLHRDFHYETQQIPNDVLSDVVNSFTSELKTIIQVSTKDDIREALQQLIEQSLAVPSEDVDLIADALEHYGVNTRLIENRELAIVLNTRKNRAVDNAQLFVTQLYYAITDKSMLIKSDEELDDFNFRLRLNASRRSKIVKLVNDYLANCGSLESLALHFRPNRRVWLMLRKHIPELRPIVNGMKRISEKKRVDHTSSTVLEKDTDYTMVDIYQLIKISNYLREKLLIEDGDAQIYRVRNGRAFIKANAGENVDNARVLMELTKINNEIARRYKDKDVTIYLPDAEKENIAIAMPTSVKNFVGQYPMYTVVRAPKPCKIGMYWTKNTDMDLHVDTFDREHIGYYSHSNRYDIKYSGDMTCTNSAGMAAEMMLVNDDVAHTYSINPYSNKDCDVTLFVGTTNIPDLRNSNVAIEPKEIIFASKHHIEAANGFAFGTHMNDLLILTNFKLGGRVPDEVNQSQVSALVLRKASSMLDLVEFSNITGIPIVNQKQENSIDFSNFGICANSFTSLLDEK